MANLSTQEAQNLIKTPNNKSRIDKCIKHDERIRFHTEPVLDKKDENKAATRFLKQVKDFLPSEKYTRFSQLFQYPVPTNELTDAIYSELSRALEGGGGFTKITLQSESQENSFKEYLKSIKHSEKWKSKAWEAFKNSIHSILIIDQPSEEVSPPRPYCYFLDISRVIDMEVESNSTQCEYIIFTSATDEDVVYVFDDSFYRWYRKNTAGEYIIESEVSHDIGYCPAKPFWNTNLNSSDNIQKQSAITKSLSQLDKILFWETSIEYYNTYGVFPIIWSYEQKQNEENSQSSDTLNLETLGGIDLPLDAFHPAYTEIQKNQQWRENKGKGLLGSGSFVTIPAPTDSTDADLRDPFGFMQIQVDSLKFADEYLEKRKDNIFKYCVGDGGEPVNNQAKNEKQIQGGFESKTNILEWISDNFEMSENWVLRTKAIIIFGADAVKSIERKLGRKYYLKTVQELNEQYKEEKSSGLPFYLLSQTRSVIAETKFKGNQELLDRSKILADLEPYPDLTINEIQTFIDKLDPVLVNLKLNFDNYIRKFEREELNLVAFGSEASYSNKIESIKKTLTSYVTVIKAVE